MKKSPAATPGFSLLRFDAMEVSVRRDDAALTDLSDEWLALWRRDPAASPFHTPQYARAAWETELQHEMRPGLSPVTSILARLTGIIPVDDPIKDLKWNVGFGSVVAHGVD